MSDEVKKVTIVYRDFDKISQEYLSREQSGWQISPRLIMELDNEGPFFSAFSQDIRSDTILASENTATFAITIPEYVGRLLAASDGSQVASMTIADLGRFFVEQHMK